MLKTVAEKIGNVSLAPNKQNVICEIIRVRKKWSDGC